MAKYAASLSREENNQSRPELALREPGFGARYKLRGHFLVFLSQGIEPPVDQRATAKHVQSQDDVEPIRSCAICRGLYRRPGDRAVVEEDTANRQLRQSD